jgi:hypothetical protein
MSKRQLFNPVSPKVRLPFSDGFFDFKYAHGLKSIPIKNGNATGTAPLTRNRTAAGQLCREKPAQTEVARATKPNRLQIEKWPENGVPHLAIHKSAEVHPAVRKKPIR